MENAIIFGITEDAKLNTIYRNLFEQFMFYSKNGKVHYIDLCKYIR